MPVAHDPRVASRSTPGDLHVNAFEMNAIVFHAGINFVDDARDTARNLIRDMALRWE